ncbi:hypothetical protein VTJ83DRAFT_1696 [Remersonia thermophila]|uniref:Wbp11/ELF5/Saf1 N-terminal domain-containing protein n=1 Tax=Remersonia thermophila TaxID=72144 RepID=A0ABR4DGM6_9PEZI
MAKERNYNPVQAHHKAEKARAIKKGKEEKQARRNEKLAQRNPARIQQQIDDLKALKEKNGKLAPHEEQALEALERDLKAVKKAREALGDKAPKFREGPPRPGGQRGDGGVLGKRSRNADEDVSSSDSDVPEDVKRIPMPRDTPPPIPKEILDEWYAKRRARRNANRPREEGEQGKDAAKKPAAPVVESKTVYEAKPVVRDLRKEATSAFVPAAVRMKLEKGKGKGGLLEPEEADQLEREGYLRVGGAPSQPQPQPQTGAEQSSGPRPVTVEEGDED